MRYLNGPNPYQGKNQASNPGYRYRFGFQGLYFQAPKLKLLWLPFESALPRSVAKVTWEGTAWHEFHQHKFPQSGNSSQ